MAEDVWRRTRIHQALRKIDVFAGQRNLQAKVARRWNKATELIALGTHSASSAADLYRTMAATARRIGPAYFPSAAAIPLLEAIRDHARDEPYRGFNAQLTADIADHRATLMRNS